MIEITISGPRQSGRSTRAVEIAKAFSEGRDNVVMAYPTSQLANWASRRFVEECFSSEVVSEHLAGRTWNVVVVDDLEHHSPETICKIRYHLASRPNAVLVAVTKQEK
jgi:hypothetical protein